MTPFNPQQARADLVAYLKAVSAHRPEDAERIQRRYGLDDLDPLAVCVGIEAASLGRDPHQAVDDHLEGSE